MYHLLVKKHNRPAAPHRGIDMIPQPILLMPSCSIEGSSVMTHQIMVITKNIKDENSMTRFVYRKYMPLNNQDTSQME